MSRLRFVGLEKTFGSYQALSNITLDVAHGSLLALLGPSGCGKTTILNLLAGFQQPSGGEIWLDDDLLCSAQRMVPPEQRGISLVFQSYAVWPHKSVAENVAFGLQLRRLPKPEVAERVRRILDAVKLGALQDRYPHELSGGQQQRVALARALAVEPRVLLLDEPLSNLDAHLREEMRYEIRRVHDMLGLTTVLVTHDQAEALVTADRVAVLHRGVLQQVGEPEQVFENPANDFVASFIGNSNVLIGTSMAPGEIRIGNAVMRGLDRLSGSAPTAALCIRPAQVQLSSAPAADGNSFNATVQQTAYLGEKREVIVRSGDGLTIRAAVAPAERFQIGQAVTVTLPVSACRIVDTHAPGEDASASNLTQTGS